MAGLALVGLLSGCGSPADDSEGGEAGAAPGFFEDLVTEAQDGGASENQLSILRQAVEEGMLDVEGARAAARAVVQCFQDNGLEAKLVESTTDTGTARPDYQVEVLPGMSDADLNATIKACEDAEFTWVNIAFQMQPSTQQAQIDYINSKEDQLRACLEDAGIQTDPEANGYELAQQAVQTPASTGGCLEEAGITNF
ncbi:hypothetical protein ICW40_18150 [Actinotalea ferrariae]|uniref:hypothetical protein n=1 Tax=Actinotalea ferrariae TaxID=1386098 RepID=UPI001C8B1A73|nr:hypothetical protein [Actinotalea ferrariae]MBX9246715.1 hypothetical protein [Actinotalea ferrariae]